MRKGHKYIPDHFMIGTEEQVPAEHSQVTYLKSAVERLQREVEGLKTRERKRMMKELQHA